MRLTRHRVRRCGLSSVWFTAALLLTLLFCVVQQAGAYYMLETFDGNVWGSDWNLGYIDKNYSGGPNVAPNGSGNPWFGAGYNLSAIAGQRNGTNSARSATAVWMQNEMNIAYRFNGGNAFTQNIYVDYWYYNNATSNKQNLLDHLSLMYYSGLPTNTDYPTPLSLGTCSCDVWYGAPGYKRTSDSTWWWNYNAGTVNSGGTSSTATGNGWVVGWTNLRIVIGAKSGSTCPISFYQNGNLVATVNSIADPKFNMIMLTSYKNTMWSATYDDIKFGGMPANPVAAAPTLGTDQITWNWTESTTNAEGYKIYDAATGGNLIGTVTGSTPGFTETGLIANSRYARWVCAYDGPFETPRVALPATYTLPPPPSIPENIYPLGDEYTVYSSSSWPGIYNLSGFGTDGGVSKFKYKWSTSATDTLAEGEGTDWVSDWVLMSAPPSGTWYLYFRSYNADGKSNPTVLQIGPYHFSGGHAITLNNCQVDRGSVSGPASAENGDPVTVIATPNAGYSFAKWTRDQCDGSNVASTDASYTFTMPNSDVTLYASFKPDPVVTINNCTPTGGTVQGAGPAKPGSSVTVRALSNTGYNFGGWTTDSCGGSAFVSTNPEYTFTMGDSDTTLYANFVPDKIECIANSGPNYFGFGGYWGPSGNATCGGISCKYGPSNPVGAFISVTPPSGMPGGFYDVQTKFTDFSGFYASTSIITTSEITAGAVGVTGDMVTGTTANWQHANAGCNYKSLGVIKLNPGVTRPTLKWQYSSGTVDNNSNRWYLWGVQFVRQDPSQFASLNVTAGPGGTASSNHTADPDGLVYYLNGDVATVTATPDTANGYIFSNWTDTYNNVVSTDNPYSFFAGTVSGVRANFVAGCTVFTEVNPAPAGTVTGAGGYTCGTQATVTATANPGYTFAKWTSDAQGTVTVSTANPYVFTTSGNRTLYAQFTADSHVLLTAACGNGTVTPGGTHGTGESVTVVATPAQGYRLKNWTKDGCDGTDVASTSASYTFNMPASDLSLFANFVQLPQLTVAASPAAGGTVAGGGYFDPGASVTVTATTNPNFWFRGWSTKADGTAMVSRKPSYTFSMPTNNYALYAIFAKAKFFEGFEGLATGSLVFNDSAGANKANNGDRNSGNPWMGYHPVDSLVMATGTSTTLSGSNVLSVPLGYWDCFDVVNVAYRANAGVNYTGDFYLEWEFYDPKGSTGGNLFQDYAGIGLYPATILPNNADYAGTDTTITALKNGETQRIQIGGASDTSAGYDATKYQYRGIGATGGYGTKGWVNTTVTRSVGWHRCRIAVGPQKGNLRNDVSLYIDDMFNPVATFESTSTDGFNAIEVMNAETASTNVAAFYDNFELLTPGTQSIDKWCYIGHYAYGTGSEPERMTTDFFAPDGSETTMMAQPGATYNGKTWALCNGGVVDFNKLYGAATNNGVSYLFTYIVNNGPAITDAELSGGSDDGWRAWLNGSLVLDKNVYRGFNLDQDRVGPLTINHGINTLLVKVTQGSADYRGQARITRMDGSPLGSSVKFVASDEGPYGTVAINGGAPTTINPNVTLTLSAIDDLGTVASMAFSTDNVTWTPFEPYATTKAWTFDSALGTKTIYAQFQDNVGNVGPVCSASISLEASATPVAKISDLWAKSNGPAYSLTGKTVTCVAGNAFWIEETNRTAGIKVIYNGTMPAKDHSVDVTGVLDSTSGERVLNASSVVDHGATGSISALGVVERAAAGRSVNADTPSIVNGTGLYNVGLLVRIAGKATNANSSDPNNKYFYLDDGSGLLDGPTSGIKVVCGSVTPPSSGVVRVTGVVSVVAGKPVLVIREGSDIAP